MTYETPGFGILTDDDPDWAPACGMCMDKGSVWVAGERWPCPLRCGMRLVTWPEPGTVIGGLED